MSGGKDGQTLFHRILPATARGLTSTTAVDWYLKAKNKKCNVGLIKHYYFTVSMKKSINLFIQQMLKSHELNEHAHFWPGPPKNHWNNFLLFCICTNMQKISSFHQFLSTGFVIWIGILCFLQCKRDKNILRFNLIVLHLCDNDFMFYFDICIKFRLSTTISTMKQW